MGGSRYLLYFIEIKSDDLTEMCGEEEENGF